jgi:hypothetical protein
MQGSSKPKRRAAPSRRRRRRKNSDAAAAEVSAAARRRRRLPWGGAPPPHVTDRLRPLSCSELMQVKALTENNIWLTDIDLEVKTSRIEEYVH